MNYSRAVKTLLAIREMSQKDLAEAMRVSESQISRLGKDENSPSAKTLEKVADALRVPVYLLVLLASEENDLPGMSMEQASALGSQLMEMLLAVERQATTRPRRKNAR